MATVALPFILTGIGSALPVVGGFITDVLAFTGASAIIQDVADLVFKPSPSEIPKINPSKIVKSYDRGEKVADIGEGISELIKKVPK